MKMDALKSHRHFFRYTESSSKIQVSFNGDFNTFSNYSHRCSHHLAGKLCARRQSTEQHIAGTGRGTRASYGLANWIRSQGYYAKPYPGPSAEALVLIPPAIAAGLGELGKHGSLISRQFGSGVRLAGVTTDMPLVATGPDRFGGDEFCKTCQVCTNSCPPEAISEHKQLVRGVERWYVDFDKCIPYFAETASCGICFAMCPWTRPDARPKLLATMARRLGQTPPEP